MLENRKTFVWFAIVMIVFGLFVFLISLIATMSASKIAMHERERTLYFDRKILPDHVFYPLIVVVDRLELKMSEPEERIVLEMDYAGKRLEAAKALFKQEKNDLAFVTLNKAHQYLLKANEDVFNLERQGKYLNFTVGLNKKFQQEYEKLKENMDDAQKARTQVMIEELQAVGGKL